MPLTEADGRDKRSDMRRLYGGASVPASRFPMASAASHRDSIEP